MRRERRTKDRGDPGGKGDLDRICEAEAEFIGSAPLAPHNGEQKGQKKHPSSARFLFGTSVCVCVRGDCVNWR